MGDPLRLVVLGDPVAHSMSPTMHRAALAALGLAGTYEARRVDADGIRRAADEMRAGALDGANITMPHKVLAARLADRLDARAERAGSVNTWVPEDGRIVGWSTDIIGIERLCSSFESMEVTILGTGGAAAACLVAFEGRSPTVVGRRHEAATALVERVGVPASVARWDTPVAGGLVVNCTSVGMAGEAMPTHLVEGADAYFEMVYASGETPAEASARRRGVPVIGGLELLAAQAESSFRLWTGSSPPPGVMYRSVTNTSRARSGGPNHA